MLDFEFEFMYNLTHLWANFCFDLVIIVIYLVQFKVDTFFLHTKFMIGLWLIICNKNLYRIPTVHSIFHDKICCSAYSIHNLVSKDLHDWFLLMCVSVYLILFLLGLMDSCLDCCRILSLLLFFFFSL